MQATSITPDRGYVPLTFTERFSSKCGGPVGLDSEAYAMLGQLESAGYFFSETIMRGSAPGTSWPVLFPPEGKTFYAHDAFTFKEYLQQTTRDSANRSRLGLEGRVAILDLRSKLRVISPSASLDIIRSNGAFLGAPGKAAGTPFTVEQLMGGSLLVLEEGKCLVLKQGRVLACSHGVPLLSVPLGFRPCQETPKLTAALNYEPGLKELLPYINALPRNFVYLKV